jgi:hypothetical protein
MFRKQKMAVGTPETNKTIIEAVKYSSNRGRNTLVEVLCPADEGGSRNSWLVFAKHYNRPLKCQWETFFFQY